MNRVPEPKKERWLRLASVYEDLDLEKFKEQLWLDNISLRGVFIHDRSAGMNAESLPASVPIGFVRSALRSEFMDQAQEGETSLSSLHPDIGMLCADEYLSPDGEPPDLRAYVDLEISEHDYQYVIRLSQKRKRGRPPKANYDFIEQTVKQNIRLLRAMKTDVERYRFLTEKHYTKYAFAPSQSQMLRKVKPIILKYIG